MGEKEEGRGERRGRGREKRAGERKEGGGERRGRGGEKRAGRERRGRGREKRAGEREEGGGERTRSLRLEAPSRLWCTRCGDGLAFIFDRLPWPTALGLARLPMQDALARREPQRLIWPESGEIARGVPLLPPAGTVAFEAQQRAVRRRPSGCAAQGSSARRTRSPCERRHAAVERRGTLRSPTAPRMMGRGFFLPQRRERLASSAVAPRAAGRSGRFQTACTAENDDRQRRARREEAGSASWSGAGRGRLRPVRCALGKPPTRL